MYPLQSALRSNKYATDEESSAFPISGDGRSNIPIITKLDSSEHSDSVKTEEAWPTLATETFESLEEKRPTRMVTWNIEEKKEVDPDQEETLSMLGRRKKKFWQKKELAEKREEEAQSWKLWFWSQGCPCLDWSPMYLFQCIDDQSTVATNDQSSTATSTFVTDDEDEDEDDSSTIQSMDESTFVSVQSMDESTFVNDDNLSNVSSNLSDENLSDESLEEELDYMQEEQATQLKPNFEANIVKDWSREGLSKNIIEDMDVYMEAMRS
jgi:hypothetical protein